MQRPTHPRSCDKDPYLVGVDPDRNTKGSSQAKVCQFDNALVVDQQILWFQVTMEHSATVTEVDALQYLVQVALNVLENEQIFNEQQPNDTKRET